MEHIAIMKKSWGLTKKILSGEKKIESRWYMTRRAPWDRITSGDMVYFKDAGEPVALRAEVEGVMQFPDLTPKKVKEILHKHGNADGLGISDIPAFFERFKGKRYCVLIFLKNPHRIGPFNIDKTGFGANSAWLTLDSVKKIRKAK